MLNNTKNNELFYKYYERWIQVYKTGAVRKVTLDKYILASEWLKKLVPNLRICDITRIEYQQLINSYADDILDTIDAIIKILGIKKCILAIKDNDSDNVLSLLNLIGT